MQKAGTTQQKVAAFRQQANKAITNGGNWNPHGTHRSMFFETEVSGVHTGAGVDTGDPVVGTPVAFTGMLVDAEPYGAYSSQLFFDSMTFGIPGGCQVACRRSRRVTARYINFFRNPSNSMIAGIASVVWQTSFAKTDLLALDPHGSQAMQAFETALAADDVLGLTVRWNTYRTIYYGDPRLRNGSPLTAAAAQELARRVAAGGWQPNPARSLMVGVLGLWRAGEPAQEPGDRALLAVQPRAIMATAHARLDDHTLTVDLANSIAETDGILSKQNLGTLTFLAVDDTGATVATLGALNYHQYDRPTYESGSGIVTLQLDDACAAAAADHNIHVRGPDGTDYLRERARRALPVDLNHYFDETDPTIETKVQLYTRGVPGLAGVEVTMYDGTDGTHLNRSPPPPQTQTVSLNSPYSPSPAAGSGPTSSFPRPNHHRPRSTL